VPLREPQAQATPISARPHAARIDDAKFRHLVKLRSGRGSLVLPPAADKELRGTHVNGPRRSRVGVDDAEGFARLVAFHVGRAAASDRNGVLRVEDALGLLFLGGELLRSRRPR
jgi:hypothetical protein